MKRNRTKSNATPAQLRRALESVMFDILAGNVTGRNPWTLDSVKLASETLTGQEWHILRSNALDDSR